MTRSATPVALHLRLLTTRLWIGALRIVALLPNSVLYALGRALGRAGPHLLRRRRRIVDRNLALCFPELSEEERRDLRNRHFVSTGMGVAETLITWWAEDRRLDNVYEIVGAKNLEAAIAQGRGVILLSAHLTSLELAIRILGRHYPLTAMYKPHANPVFERAMTGARNRHTVIPTIARDDVRSLVRALKERRVVWYAPDQTRQKRIRTRLPFFGVPSLNSNATPRLVRMSNALVVPFFMYRTDGPRYRLELGPALEGIPSGDDMADGARINALFEAAIRQAPEQYLWTHRLFKGVDELGDVYGAG